MYRMPHGNGKRLLFEHNQYAQSMNATFSYPINSEGKSFFKFNQLIF